MRLLQSVERTNGAGANFAGEGLVGWVIGLLSRWRGERTSQRKYMRVVETLTLGGRRQLTLVSCGEEYFLVGGGIDTVETIVRVSAVGLSEGEICR
jgi:Flagellar biosynthesis protein, FliO